MTIYDFISETFFGTAIETRNNQEGVKMLN